jgi:hypothetical protein
LAVRKETAENARPVRHGCGKIGIMQKLLILLGLVLLAAGLAWPWLRRLPFGRLPGDIHIAREGFSFNFPIVTCLVISIVVSLLLWIFRR